jgi:hypothetical protein
MEKRYAAQSATEYLLTYGWMILIGALIIITLFGIVSIKSNAPFACLGQPGFLCTHPSLGSSGALTMNISYTGSVYPITITGLSCNVTASNKPPSVETTNIQLYPAQQKQLEFQCPIISSSIGSINDVYLWIYYSTPYQTGLEQSVGKGGIVVQYQGVLWSVTEWTPSSTNIDLLPYSDLTANPASPSAVTNVNAITWTSFLYSNTLGWGYSTDYHNHDIYNGIQISLFPISPLSLDDAPCTGPPYASHGYTATAFVNMSGTSLFNIWSDDGTEIFYKPTGGSTWTSIFGGAAWMGQAPTEYSSSVTLPKGQYEIAVDYIDICDPAGLSVVEISPPPQT